MAKVLSVRSTRVRRRGQVARAQPHPHHAAPGLPRRRRGAQAGAPRRALRRRGDRRAVDQQRGRGEIDAGAEVDQVHLDVDVVGHAARAVGGKEARHHRRHAVDVAQHVAEGARQDVVALGVGVADVVVPLLDVVAREAVGQGAEHLEGIGQAPAGVVGEPAEILGEEGVGLVVGVDAGPRHARDDRGVHRRDAAELGPPRHLVEVEERGLHRDLARDVVAAQHEQEGVAAAVEDRVHPRQGLRRALASAPVVLHPDVEAGTAQQRLQTRRISLLHPRGVVPGALGDAVAESQ